jgi:hypothetical protein
MCLISQDIRHQGRKLANMRITDDDGKSVVWVEGDVAAAVLSAYEQHGLRMFEPIYDRACADGGGAQFGLQAVYGGQALSLMIGAMSRSWKDLENTLPKR